jgi:bacillithiol system protein YtxJ
MGTLSIQDNQPKSEAGGVYALQFREREHLALRGQRHARTIPSSPEKPQIEGEASRLVIEMPSLRSGLEEITSRAECRALLDQEFAVLFKHSAACGNSRSVYQTVAAFSLNHPDLRIHLLSVTEYPTLAQFIAQQTGIRHESPQILVMHQGKVVVHGSHWAITKRFLAGIRLD